MICPNCKKDVPDHSAFCPECGKQLEEPNNSVAQIQPQKTTNLGKKPIIIIIGVLVVFLIIFIASKVIKPTINLGEYISVTFMGYDTVGEAVVEFDTEKFQDKYKGKLPSDFSDEYINYSLDKSYDLSNGDTVTLTWDCDDETALSRYGYKLNHEDTAFSVSGLTEIGTFDPFDGIDVVFEGISSEGTAALTGSPTSAAAQELDYSLDIDDSLANGDTVTVSATNYGSDPTHYCIENYGLKPSSFTKTYTVEGLAEYVTSLSEITDESMAQMQQQAMDVLNAYVANSWNEDEVFQGATYMGAYLLTTKNTDSYRDNNCIYLVYNVKVEHSYEYNDTTYHNIDELYWYVAYKDLVVDADGTITVDVLAYDTPSNHVNFYPDPDRQYWYWWYYGYSTLEELFDDTVTTNLAEYNYEDGILTE